MGVTSKYDAAEVKARADILQVIGRRASLEQRGDKYVALCPFPSHTETTPSFTVYPNPADPHYHCYGCDAHGDVIQFLIETEGLDFVSALESLAKEYGVSPAVKGDTPLHAGPGLTVEALATAKKLPEEFLQGLGLSNSRSKGVPRVSIPYPDSAGNAAAMRYRLSLKTDPRFLWRKGDRVMPYGLPQMKEAHSQGWLLIVEGESDCWAAWHHGLPALGVPGKDNWQSAWAIYLEGIAEVYVWVEPGANSFAEKIGRDCPNIKVIKAPPGVKDIADAHLEERDLRGFLEELKQSAIPFEELSKARKSAAFHEAMAGAASVLIAPDPLELVRHALRAGGYAAATTTLRRRAPSSST
jgi:hypothetical protein